MGLTNYKDSIISLDLKLIPPPSYHTLPDNEIIHNHAAGSVHLFTLREESARSRTVRYVVALKVVVVCCVVVVVTHAKQATFRQ